MQITELHKELQITKDDHLQLAEDNLRLKISIAPNCEVLIEEKGKNGTIMIVVGENAKLTYKTASPAKRTILLKKDARITWQDANTNAENIIYLVGEGADAQYKATALAKDSQALNMNTIMVHEASHTNSRMHTKTVLLDNANGVYRGTIRILPNAKGCDAYQREDTLLLGNGKMDAAPILEISNNDVKCSHAVTLGQIDEEKLFYFASRGIPRDLAIKTLIEGFLT